MFFKKDKSFAAEPQNNSEIQSPSLIETVQEVSPVEETAHVSEAASEETAFPYSFYKPEPYPKDLVSVITKMLKRMFPDTRKAYLLEAQQNKKKGYLLIVDIEPKFLKIINIYIDGETKKVRGNVPIECVLYSKSGTITEGIDPFYVKETAESKANNLASKEFSGEVVFSDMPEFELWKNTEKKDIHPSENVSDGKDALAPLDDENAETQSEENAPSSTGETPSDSASVTPDNSETEEINTAETEEKPHTKVKPSTKQELFRLLNEYGAKKTDAVSTVAMAAIKEFVFYIPYSCNKTSFSNQVDTTLPIDESLRFEKIVNPDDEKTAVPLYTEKEEALGFAEKNNSRVVILKYKDFASSRAAELTAYDGVVINPDNECIFFPADHPLISD